MKILILSKFCNLRGGIERYVEETSKRLINFFDIDIACSKSNIKILRASFSLSYFKVFFSKYDLLHVHSPNPFAELLALFCRKPVIVTHHNDAMRFGLVAKIYNKLIVKPLYRKTKYIITTSLPYSENSKILSEFKDKLVVIPNGVDTKIFRRDNKYERNIKESYFIFVGRLVRYKAVDIILKAFNQLDDKNCKLVIVGTGSEKERLVNYVKDYNLLDRVKFLENISDREYKSYLQYANCLLLPSRTTQEGFGLTLLEAMSMGVPVIGSKISAMPWIIKEGVSGYLVEPENALDLSEKMKLFLDSKRSKEMGKNALNDVKERFDWDKIVKDKFVPLFKRV